MLIALNKPYRVLTQFSTVAGKRTLSDLIAEPHVYPAGRLDYDSEGLLLLTDDGALQHLISRPESGVTKRYLVQVDGEASSAQIAMLRRGVAIEGRRTLPAKVNLTLEPGWLWHRDPPIRVRQALPTCWLEIAIQEGRNRQVRKMTAAVGLATLRLVRIGIGELDLFALDLAPGQSKRVRASQIGAQLLQMRTTSPNRGATRSATRARRLP